MHVEIERKYLVSESWSIPEGCPSVDIGQAYLSAQDAPVEVRLRRQGDRCLMTLKRKTGDAIARDELEFEAAHSTFADAWQFAPERVSKSRYTVSLRELVATVDVLDEPHGGVRIVEVEFDSLEQARAFVAPAWFDREVTGDPAWSNRALAAGNRPARSSNRRS